MDLNQISKPTLMLSEKIAKRNIAKMANKAEVSNAVFRPHFKTHFSAEIGEWYREVGVTKCTCSSIDMAMYFAAHGWDDITIAFPVNIRQTEDLNNLAKRVKLNLVVESVDAVNYLNGNLRSSVGLLIKIDTGYRRTGVWHKELTQVQNIISAIDDPHHFEGLLAHFGHTYKERDKESIRSIYKTEVGHLHQLRNALKLADCFLSVGDTPSCSIVEDFSEVNEIRPGNFVFYDLMQSQISSCGESDIAVCLAVPIVAIHPERNELVVHGGGVHLSKDRIRKSDEDIFGQAVLLSEKGWEFPKFEMIVKSLSQEHGKIDVGKMDINRFSLGDLIGVLPIHSCLTANLMKEYLTINGDTISTIHS